MANDVHSLKTASKRIRHLGSARSGVAASRAMHLTSLALMPLTIAFVWILIGLIHKDYAGVRAEFARPFPALAMLLFIEVSIYHMKLGMQVIIDDYVHDHHVKDYSLVANTFFSALAAVVCAYAILKVSFAG